MAFGSIALRKPDREGQGERAGESTGAGEEGGPPGLH